MAILHLPPAELTLNDSDRLYFLAGPIQGAPDWQKEAAAYLDHIAPNQAIHIANPRWDSTDVAFRHDAKRAQIRWEKRNLWRASQNGGILFWLAKRDFSLPYKREADGSERAYAQTTRKEFGRAMGWLDYNPTVHVALGMEPGYIGNVDYYEDSAEEFGIPIHSTLKDTCDYLLRRIERIEYADL